MEHTKGEWYIDRERLSLTIMSPDDTLDPWAIATILGNCGTGRLSKRGNTQEAEANARLFSAAPNLLAACEAAAGTVALCIDPNSRAGIVLEQMQAAIKKAKEYND